MNVCTHPNHSRPFATVLGFLLLLTLTVRSSLLAQSVQFAPPEPPDRQVNTMTQGSPIHLPETIFGTRPLSVTTLGDLPVGINFIPDPSDSTGYHFTGTIHTPGTYDFSLIATDPSGNFDTKYYRFQVAAISPTFPMPLFADCIVETLSTFEIGAQPTSTTFAKSGAPWPDWLELNTETGTITANSPPRSLIGATVGYGFTAFNGDLISPQVRDFTFTFVPAPAPVITTITNRVVKVDHWMQHHIETTPNADTYSMSGSPLGLELRILSGGRAVIDGTPSVRGSYIITVNATFAGVTGSTNIHLTVTHRQPSMSRWDSVTLMVGEPFTYTVTTNPTAEATPTLFEIPDGSHLPQGLTINPTNGVISGIPELAAPENRCYIRATNEGGEAFTSIFFTVWAPQAPLITTITNGVWQVDHWMQHHIETTPNADTYSMSGSPPGLELRIRSGGRAVINGTPSVRGSYIITVNATFAGVTGSTNIHLRVTHHQPWMPTSHIEILTVGEPFTYTVTTNPTADETPTRFEIPDGSRLPQGLSINATSGVISGIPEVAATESRCYIRATNEGGEGFMFIIFTVLAPQPPVITSPNTASATAGEPFTCTITASNSPTSYGATGLPPGLSINPVTGEITGTPESEPGSVFEVTISATNEGGTTTQIVTLTIVPPAPLITSPLTARARVGELFVYSIISDNNPNRFSALDDPPDPRVDDMLCDEGSGVITWRPPNVSGGTYYVDLQIYADNGVPPTAHEVLRVFVFPQPPVITNVPIATARVEERFGFQIITSPSAPETPTTFSATGLPVGLTISDAGFIQGFPERVETRDAIITARNNGGEGRQIFRIDVRPPLPSITSAITATGTLGIPFSYTITATGDPSSFSANLPLELGLELDTLSGLISGTPAIVGTFPVTLFAANVEGRSEPRILSLTVRVADFLGTPVITSPITATAIVGEPFTPIYTITATENPVTFLAVGLPLGLHCNPITGVISGTPTRGGIYTVTLYASNIAHVGSGILTLRVSPEPPVITSPLTARARVGREFSYTITATGISPISLSVGDLPLRLRFDAANNEIYGFAAGPETYRIPLLASNAGGTTTETLTLNVGRFIRPYFPNLPPRRFQPFNYPFNSHATGSSFSEKGLPPGFSIDPKTSEISGTTTARGSYDVTIFASTANDTNSLTFTLVVADLLFKKVDNSITITGTNPRIGGDLVIPATIDDLPVASIDAEAFRDYPELSSVEIPEGVTSIGNSAFSGCPELTRITFLGNAPVAGNSVFLNTPEVKVYYLPSKVGWSNTFADRWTARMIPPPVLTSFDFGYYWEGTMDRYLITSDPTVTETGVVGILPLGLRVDPFYLDIWGAPESGTAGHYPVTLWARNEGGTTTKDFTFFVFPKPPVITSPHTATACVGESFFYATTATGSPDGFFVVGSLPPFLTLDSTSGLISGPTPPGSEGTYAITLKAYNLGGPGDPHSLTLTVSPPAPVITSPSRVYACVGEPFPLFTISATGSPSSFSAIGLPPGLTITLTGVILGTPTIPGLYIVSLSASNACGSGSQKLEIIVNAAAPVITSPSAAVGYIGTRFDYTILATHFPTSFGAMRFFPLPLSTLPVDLRLESSLITGIPLPGSEGTYLITLYAINGCGVGRQTLELTIRPSVGWWPRIRFDPARKRTFMVVQDGGEKTFAVEYSDDFKLWIPLVNKLVGETDLSELDPESTIRPFRFYRVRQP